MKTDTLQKVELATGVEIQLQAAGPFARALAWLVDLIYRVLLYLLLSIVFGFLGALWGWHVSEGFMYVSAFLILWFYPVYFEYRRGATPGKKVMKLKVVQLNGAPITFSQAVIRNFLRMVDFMPFYYGLGLTACAASDRFQRLGDLAADTLVIYAQPLQLKRRSMQQHFEPLAPAFAMNREEQQAIIYFLELGGILSDARKEELAEILAPVLHKTGKEGVEQLFSIGVWLRDAR